MYVAGEIVELNLNGIRLAIRRDDLNHPDIPGNKLRKLKYNLEEARSGGFKTVLTFGGAFSNHISAVSEAGRIFGFQTIGVIRGEELAGAPLNPTLSRAVESGMRLHFVTREQYRQKSDEDFINNLQDLFGPFYLLPEGGTNESAIKGCEEILQEADKAFDYICCAVGTGGTLAGLSRSSGSNQKVIGYPALKESFLENEISRYSQRDNWFLERGYDFGGYGKVTVELVEFINSFYRQYEIPLDPIYTGKMMFGVMDGIKRGRFPKRSSILAIHTGGLQGIAGINERLTKKQLPTIEIHG